ncbi:hypothetical protein [Heyndrickxia sporothermodurans]|uniref:hypothetical protein n=1 Tax=Heyndrickxia sporothermodurans TaxID=46224 RepID=UPI000D358755|nr:hypothetical protein [Heyndrickxia sporothermodurans]PTY92942.1 hypothetical protein B5V90_02355 [Heyndrickxia sporothermodurans]
MAEKRIYPKHDDDSSGIWVSIDKWIVNQDKILYPEDYQDASDLEIDYKDRFYRGRNYFLFHVLAGVRGSSSWGPIISEPKGVPEDSCQQIKDEVKSWDSDGHSHSHLTLAELLAFDWNAKVEDEARFYDKAELDKFLHKLPAEDLIHQSEQPRGKHTLYIVQYRKPYKDFFPDFMETMARMNESLESHRGETSDDVRLVFFFDN